MNSDETPDDDVEPDGITGTEIVGDAVPKGGGVGIDGGGIGGGTGGPEGIQAMVAGAGAGSGDPEVEPMGLPQFSQNLANAAFCAPHSPQNRTDSRAMTGSRPAGLGSP
jgi:hypothetical protein